MTTTPHNPIQPDDADLLAWVEGEKLRPEMDAAVARLLMSDPSLARAMEAMRRDRDVLRSLEDEKAPAGLIEAVEAALQPVLERQLLLGLQEGEPVESRPVVSMVRSEKRGIFQTFLADRSGRRMAMAAGLLLVVGGGTYWATTMLSHPPQQPLTLAINDKKEDKARELSKPDEPMRMAANSKSVDSIPEVPRGTSGTKIASAVSDASSVVTDVQGPDLVAVGDSRTDAGATFAFVGPVKASVDASLAAELAREGKLVIRVVSSQAGRTPVSVAEHLKKDCSGPGWKLGSDVPSAIAVAVAPEPVDWKQIVALHPAPEVDVTVADDGHGIGRGLEGLVGPPAPAFDLPPMAVEDVPSVYMLQARLDAATMAAVKTSLQKAGRADEVVFEERYEALPVDQNAPILNPNAMIWWTNPPSGWTKWGEVPVVIDPRK